MLFLSKGQNPERNKAYTELSDLNGESDFNFIMDTLGAFPPSMALGGFLYSKATQSNAQWKCTHSEQNETKKVPSRAR